MSIGDAGLRQEKDVSDGGGGGACEAEGWIRGGGAGSMVPSPAGGRGRGWRSYQHRGQHSRSPVHSTWRRQNQFSAHSDVFFSDLGRKNILFSLQRWTLGQRRWAQQLGAVAVHTLEDLGLRGHERGVVRLGEDPLRSREARRWRAWKA